MKRRFLAASCVAHAMVRDVRAGRLRSKTGEGEISTEPLQSILELPGEPIFCETGTGGTRSRIVAIPHRSDSPSSKHSWTAVRHLTNALLLSKPAEPPRTFVSCSGERVLRVATRVSRCWPIVGVHQTGTTGHFRSEVPSVNQRTFVWG